MKASGILRNLHAELGVQDNRKEVTGIINRYMRLLDKEQRKAVGQDRQMIADILRFIDHSKAAIMRQEDADNEYLRGMHDKITRTGGEE
ncbi:hypothetical protein AB685_00475 [Bacillus sp. LL01]|uniref:hypothetical protein n=1 Tax=Bacillus sp. LL01 TaxID=1665556 RepID=UPI00064D1BF6|nr:hypothetical protein [Bacillus sp. LL01]KMJ59400.1 hypothetical protein AB685_00475 [Bacillus sp. LL01]